ncbi:MAG: NADPH:quinone oxidoreductase family protein [Alphaproteobacteria bacterium]|nr:NADPH:quinone oxidoreductase family protein [Alphaproteobacteria bacterium]
MKAVLCKAFGGPETLVVEEVPSPPIGRKDVRIAVHAAGLNFPDTLIIQGKYQFKPPFPFSPGLEVAGVVEAVGPEVTLVAPGQRVMATTGHGGFAEEAVATEEKVYPIPDRMSFEEAAGFPITYGTTYHALVDRAQMKPGEWLLVHGAGGGVGLNAVELGRLMGAKVIATAGSPSKLALAKEYGADYLIDYSKEKIRDRVKEITGGNGADVIYDPVGGDVFDESMRCIAWNGRLLVIGFASGRIPEVPANLVLLKGCQIVGVFWGSFAARDPDANRHNFQTLLGWFDEGRLKPYVSGHYRLEEVPQAMNALLARKVSGKAVIKVR